MKVNLDMEGEIQSAARSIERWFDDLWDEVQPVVDEYTDKVFEEAYKRVPVDTGNLRSTIEVFLKRMAEKVIGQVGTQKTDYAHYQEFGTIIHDAQPYLRPSLRKYAEEFARAVASVVRSHARKARRYAK